MEKLENLVNRLSDITDRLEKCGNRGGSSESSSEHIEAFQKIIAKVQALADSSKGLDEDVHKHCLLVVDCFVEQLKIIKDASVFKKPDNDLMKKALSIFVKKLSIAQEFKSKAGCKFNNHCCSLKESVSALTWIDSPGKPSIVIDAAKESTQFYINRVLKDFKDVLGHTQWTKDILNLFEILKEYGQDYYPNGFMWNTKGKPYSIDENCNNSVCASTTASTTPAAKSEPTAAAGLFSSLQKDGLTIGLKKVTDDQKTHKNPGLRASNVVPDTAETCSKSSSTVKKETTGASKPPVLELVAKKWNISYQVGNQDIKITGDNKHAAYFFSCRNSLATISDKLNSLVLESCKNTSIVVESGLISTLEVINCQSVKIQCNDLVPTLNVDKSSAVDIFLTEKSFDTEIISTTSNSVNVTILSGETLVEHATPEQFLIKYNFKEKKIETKIIEKK